MKMLFPCRQSNAAQLHSQDQPRECAFHVALDLSLTAVPAGALGKRSGGRFFSTEP